jgi:hypothetical protein
VHAAYSDVLFLIYREEIALRNGYKGIGLPQARSGRRKLPVQKGLGFRRKLPVQGRISCLHRWGELAALLCQPRAKEPASLSRHSPADA